MSDTHEASTQPTASDTRSSRSTASNGATTTSTLVSPTSSLPLRTPQMSSVGSATIKHSAGTATCPDSPAPSAASQVTDLTDNTSSGAHHGIAYVVIVGRRPGVYHNL